MPQIFKALTSISAWALFIGGCISIVVTTVNWAVFGDIMAEPPMCAFMGWALGAVDLALSAVVMKLRHMME